MLFIGERARPQVLLPLPFALAGIYLVVRGSAATTDTLGFGRWELVGVLSAILSGAAVTAMRAARRGENSWSVYASFCLLGLITTAPMGIMQWRNPTSSDWLALAAVSVFSVGAQLLLTFSLRWVDAMTVGVISQLAVIISMALGATILHERISTMAGIGALLTLGGVVGVVYFTSVGRRATAADEVAPEA
jgi:drug/metabolite transporter (DMT)-like permease